MNTRPFLGRQASAPLEMARALFVVGMISHAAGDFESPGSALGYACDYLPASDYPEDLIMILVRLADVTRDAGFPLEARAEYDGAARVASVRGYPAWSRVDPERNPWPAQHEKHLAKLKISLAELGLMS